MPVVVTSNAKEVAVIIRGFQARAANVSPALDRFAQWFRGRMVKQFASEGGAGNRRPWKPLSPPYAAWKSKHYPGRKILARSGRLRESLTRPGAGLLAASRNEIVIKTDVPYASFHQKGTRTLPKRQLIVMDKELRSEVERLITAHIKQTGGAP